MATGAVQGGGPVRPSFQKKDVEQAPAIDEPKQKTPPKDGLLDGAVYGAALGVFAFGVGAIPGALLGVLFDSLSHDSKPEQLDQYW